MRSSTLRYLLLLCLVQGFALRHAEAQLGVSNLWTMGYNGTFVEEPFGGVDLEFVSGNRMISTVDRSMNYFRTSATIADNDGNLLFSTNGVRIADAMGDTMMNGDGLNPSEYTSQNAVHPDGLNLSQACLILPKPNDTGTYYLLHGTLDDPFSFTAKYLYLSTVNMELDNGLGAVVDKNQVLINDTLNVGRITAVRHANGRDWWVVCHKAYGNIYYRLLVTPEGVNFVGEQAIGINRPPDVGQACFSPDGSRYAYWAKKGNYDHLEVFDFDRCTGLFSDPVHVPTTETLLAMGVAFSPNNRFIYATAALNVYQFDADATDIAGSMVQIAAWDSTYSPFPPFATGFDIAQLAPDGQIYIATGNGTLRLHVIHNPDEPGLACNMEQHGVVLPRYDANSLPNHPNYFLGPVVGSVCDSLGLGVGISEMEMQHRLQVVPNPSRGSCTVGYTAQPEAGGLEVFDPQGRRVYQSRLAAWSTMHAVHLQDAAPAIYQCRLQWGARSVSTRIVIAP